MFTLVFKQREASALGTYAKPVCIYKQRQPYFFFDSSGPSNGTIKGSGLI